MGSNAIRRTDWRTIYRLWYASPDLVAERNLDGAVCHHQVRKGRHGKWMTHYPTKKGG